ncbi:MGDG synthase family glycosyltransferase [Halalkalibacter urbisdiaboli]|uniref:MGDG synthase family glycosyltransferase n=1 Tax=Halalkalibacter urbisdiaboli TaxID=1960589 RepID=UPI000B438158|nr:glycosyltransferase [Halalkalibacter urbisdiaboli]
MNHITIFSASIGNGHNEASKALKEQFEKQGASVSVIDTFQSIHPLLHKMFLEMYLTILRLAPKIWGRLYRYGGEYSWYLIMDHVGSFFCERLEAIIKKQNTTVMISTHPFVTAFLSKLKQKKQLNIPLYTVITDLGLHPAYIRPEIDGYFTASPHIESFAKKYNIPVAQCYCTGIPIKTVPDVTIPRSEIREALQLDPHKKTLLITGGGLGLSRYVEILHYMEQLNQPLQVLCMTGMNQRVAQKITKVKSKHSIEVIPFTEKFTSYLRASDVIISKPGGLTMSEALACETPIIIYDPVPGHEEQNAELLEEFGTAVKVEFAEEMAPVLDRVLVDKHYYQTMVSNAKKLKKPDAAKKISDVIHHLEMAKYKKEKTE